MSCIDRRRTVTIVYSSQAARDGALKTNFASGMEAGYSVLADLLRSLEAHRSE